MQRSELHPLDRAELRYKSIGLADRINGNRLAIQFEFECRLQRCVTIGRLAHAPVVQPARLMSMHSSPFVRLAHDPEKHALGLDPRVESVFPRDKREAFAGDHVPTKG